MCIRDRGDAVLIDASQLTGCGIPDRLMREMRSSVIFLGALLARLGRAELSYPGGCELGPRPIDLHLAALRGLGAEITEEQGRLTCTQGQGLAGRELCQMCIRDRPNIVGLSYETAKKRLEEAGFFMHAVGTSTFYSNTSKAESQSVEMCIRDSP